MHQAGNCTFREGPAVNVWTAGLIQAGVAMLRTACSSFILSSVANG
jgi:hypothetical protein